MMSDEIPTDIQAAVHVVLRGLPLPEGARWSAQGHVILITGRARAADWPAIEIVRGDLTGVVWTTPREVPSVIDNLRELPQVVAARPAEVAAPR